MVASFERQAHALVTKLSEIVRASLVLLRDFPLTAGERLLLQLELLLLVE